MRQYKNTDHQKIHSQKTNRRGPRSKTQRPIERNNSFIIKELNKKHQQVKSIQNIFLNFNDNIYTFLAFFLYLIFLIFIFAIGKKNKKTKN